MKKWFGKLKIKEKIFVSYLLACLVPLLVCSILLSTFARDTLEDSAMEFMGQFSSQIVMNLDEFIDDFDRLTQSVLVDNEILSNLDETDNNSMYMRLEEQIAVRKMTSRMMALQPDMQMVSLMTEKGQFYYTGKNGEQVIMQTLLEEDWISDILSSNQILSISAAHRCPYYDRNQDKIVVTIGRRLLNSKGKFIGLLLIDYEQSDLVRLSQSFLTAKNQYDMTIWVANQKNQVIYDSDIAAGKAGWVESNYDELMSQLNKDYIIQMNETENYGLKVYTIVSKRNLLYQVNGLSKITWMLVFVSTCILLTLSVLLSRVITHPLGHLKGQMEKMEEGQYEVLDIATNDDEIGQLIRAYNSMVTRIKVLIKQVYLEEIKQKNAKFLALQSQINPHMLFNTLESIRMKALMCGADEVADMIKLLAKMFRITLYENAKNHKIRDEISYLHSYVRLQNMKSRNLFSLEVDLSDEIMEANIISMVFQPVVENCIEHGIRTSNIPISIRLEGMIIDGNLIRIHIIDNGRGMSEEQATELQTQLSQIGSQISLDNNSDMKEGKSIGLRNITERIKLHYGSEYYLNLLYSNSETTCVEICIPLQTEEET